MRYGGILRGNKLPPKRSASNYPNKTKGWDSRFHLNQIPDYNALSDEHCVGFRGVLQQRMNKRKVVLAPGGIRIGKKIERDKTPMSQKRSFKQSSAMKDSSPQILNIKNERSSDSIVNGDLSERKKEETENRENQLNIQIINKNASKGLSHSKQTKSKLSIASSTRNNSKKSKKRINDEEIKALVDELINQYAISNLNPKYRDIFLESIVYLNNQKAANVIVDEIQLLQKAANPLQRVEKVIEKREETLKNLKELDRKLKDNNGLLDSEKVQKEAIDGLTKLRSESFQIVKLITKWRKRILANFNQIEKSSLRLYKAADLAYTFDNQNYLLKMRSDSSFLHVSELTKLFNFAKKTDPFLLAPSIAMPHSSYLNKKLGNRMLRYAKQKGKLLVPMPSPFFKKYKECESIIEEEIRAVRAMRTIDASVHSDDAKSAQSMYSRKTVSKADNKENVKATPRFSSQASKERGPTTQSNESIKPSKEKNKTGVSGGMGSHSELRPIESIQSLGKHETESNDGVDDKFYTPNVEAEKGSKGEGQLERKLEGEEEKKENFDDLEVFPLRIPEQHIKLFLQSYYKKLNLQMQSSFSSIDKLISEADSSQDVQWLVVANKNTVIDYQNISAIPQSIIGFFVFCTDSTNVVMNRVQILHMTTIQYNIKLYNAFVRLLIQYINTNLYYHEIRLSLYHYLENKKFVVCEEIKNILTKEYKFKWKTLTNDSEGNRIMVLGLLRPNDLNFQNKRKFKIGSQPIEIKAFNILSLDKSLPDHQEDSDSCQLISNDYNWRCGILNSILGIKKQNDFQFEFDEEEKDQSLEILQKQLKILEKTMKEKEDFNFPASRATLGGNLEEVQKDIIDQKMKIEESKLIPSSEYAASVLSVELNFSSYCFVEKNNISYMRIKDANITIAEIKNKYKFIIIPTDDLSINVVFLSIDKNEHSLRKELEESKVGIGEYTKRVIQEMDVENTFYNDCKEVWIPSFQFQTQTTPISWINNYKITPELFITSAQEAGFCDFYCPKPPEGSLIIQSDENALILQNDFIFGLIHENLDEIFEIPLFLSFISKDKWRTVS